MLHRTTKSTLLMISIILFFDVIIIFGTTGKYVSAVVPLNEQQHLPPPLPLLPLRLTNRRRRLAPDKTVTTPSPTINVKPSTVPTFIETSPPTINVIPSNVPSVQPQMDANNNIPSLSLPITPPNTPSAPAPTVVVVMTPSKAPIRTNTTTATTAPTTSSSTSTLLTMNISDFDVLVTAVVTSDQAIAEQLLNYRKALRIALQDYLFQFMTTTNPMLWSTPPTQIELYAISSRTTRTRHYRNLQSSDTTGSSNSENPLTVEQWYSYGGVIAFPNGTDATTITMDSIYEQQALALSDTGAVQQSLMTTSLQNVITIQTITVRNIVNRTDDTNNPNNNTQNDDDASANTNNDNSTTIIATMIAAGSVGLIAILGIVWQCRRRRRRHDHSNHKPPVSNIITHHHPPPNGVTSPTTQASMTSSSIPFSPYGKEYHSDDEDDDNDDIDDNNDHHHHYTRNNRNHVQNIVHDLEEMEGSLQQQQKPPPPPPPSLLSPLRYSGTTTTTNNNNVLIGTNNITTEEPYLQLDLSTGHTSSTGSSTSLKINADTDHQGEIQNNSTSVKSFDERGNTDPTCGIDTVSEPQPIQYYSTNEEDMIIRPNPIDTSRMIDPASIYRHRTMNSYKVPESTTTTVGSIDPNSNTDDTRQNNNNTHINMYSVPVVSMTNSHDSMDGYSLTSGFYGGQRPMNLRTTTTTNATTNRKETSSSVSMVGSSPMPKTTITDPVVSTRSRSVPLAHFVPSQPLSMTNNTVGSNTRTPSWTKDRSMEEEYSSDSESQFTYTQVGIVPLSKLATMGPMLNSMSMDSCDSSIDNHDGTGGKLHEAADDSSMLQLDDNIGMISDSPTFHRYGVTDQHHYPNEEETPITNNAKRSLGTNARSLVPHLLDNDNGDDPSPIRATTLHLPATLDSTSRLQKNISSNNNPSLNSTLSSDIITMNKMTNHDGDIDSQPSDEVMGDSMEQDLQGFADELDRIKRDIGVSIGHDHANNSRGRKQQQQQPQPAPNRYLLQTRVPSDEFVENENDLITSTAMVIIPDDVASKRNENKIRNTRGRR